MPMPARRLLNNGIKAPLSGDPRYNVHANDIDFQIESDFIGLMTPGLPQEANVSPTGWDAYELGRRTVRRDVLRRNVRSGILRDRPAQGRRDGAAIDSRGQRLRTDHRRRAEWSAENPTTGEDLAPHRGQMGQERSVPMTARWTTSTSTRLNGAFVALGLLYGEGDFAKTLEVSARAGQDSDCNPSSAAGILGVMLGYNRIPEVWKAGITAIAERVRVHALLVQSDCGEHPGPSPESRGREPGAR